VIFEPSDVVVVPFPFTDRPASKRRPALVLSTHDFNASHDRTILAMITSAAVHPWPSDVPLLGWQDAGLAVPCTVRMKLFTLDTALIVRRVGTLSAQDSSSVWTAIRKTLTACPPS